MAMISQVKMKSTNEMKILGLVLWNDSTNRYDVNEWIALMYQYLA